MPFVVADPFAISPWLIGIRFGAPVSFPKVLDNQDFPLSLGTIGLGANNGQNTSSAAWFPGRLHLFPDLAIRHFRPP